MFSAVESPITKTESGPVRSTRAGFAELLTIVVDVTFEESATDDVDAMVTRTSGVVSTCVDADARIALAKINTPTTAATKVLAAHRTESNTLRRRIGCSMSQ